jgi:uncharacterized protein YyaL (SSP411 family)
MPNRLAQESSPYLLQHAGNPVDWFPWSDEAWQRARNEDKPVFLSIGYSACHWCHVMAHESFENPKIADYLNHHFVSIKVDREERPEIDQIYMAAVMAMQGHGGWPLSTFLTPDQDFFFGGTYWPPTSRASMPGFDRILASVIDAWQNKRVELVTQSRQITQMIQASSDEGIDAQQPIDPQLLNVAASALARRFDAEWGGFGEAPKFPHPMDLSLLQRLANRPIPGHDESTDRAGSEEILEMIRVSLDRMAMGGIHDHLGGGFARYSVDERWLVPHFEKMLYDNALLARVYLQDFRSSGRSSSLAVCRSTLDYLLRDMTDPEGGFCSAEDADSEGEEGKYYVWSREEIVEHLGDETGNRFCQLYGVTAHGNFEGHNILNLRQSVGEFAVAQEMEADRFVGEMAEARLRLLSVRQKRIRPLRDDKVITSWNGMAIEALADAALATQDIRYANAARRAGEFLWNNLRDAAGRLLHTWRNGQARHGALLDDYAWTICAFLSLYRIDFDSRWIDRARETGDGMIRHFFDEPSGSFFYTADDHESLIARTRDQQDGAVPGGNSMAALACLRLGRICGDLPLQKKGQAAIAAAMPFARRAPLAVSQMLIAIHVLHHDKRQFVLVGGPDETANTPLIDRLQQTVPLEGTLICLPSAHTASGPASSLTGGKRSIDRQPTLYICEDFQCAQPLVGVESIAAWLTRHQVWPGTMAGGSEFR